MNLLEELKSGGLRGVWLGNDSWLISDGARVVGMDLDLRNPERLEQPAITPEELAGGLDLHLITHEHEDHFNAATCRALLEYGNTLFVIPESCESKANELGFPSNRRRIVHPGRQIEELGVELETVRAVHGHIGGAVYSGASMLDCGYRFRLGGKWFYQPGDTLLLEEHQQMAPADVLFVSPTEHNTWIEGSYFLIQQLNPGWIFPQHHSTYAETPENRFWTHGYVEELRRLLPQNRQERFYLPEQGQVFRLDQMGLHGE